MPASGGPLRVAHGASARHAAGMSARDGAAATPAIAGLSANAAPAPAHRSIDEASIAIAIAKEVWKDLTLSGVRSLMIATYARAGSPGSGLLY